MKCYCYDNGIAHEKYACTCPCHSEVAAKPRTLTQLLEERRQLQIDEEALRKSMLSISVRIRELQDEFVDRLEEGHCVVFGGSVYANVNGEFMSFVQRS
jgi:hypothetical protein